MRRYKEKMTSLSNWIYFRKSKEICEPLGIPVEVIPMIDYGMMNGKNVLDFALKLAEQ